MDQNKEKETMQEEGVQTSSAEETLDLGTVKPGRGGKKKWAVAGIIAAVLVVAGVAGAMNAKTLSNLWKEKTSSPAEYYRYVERENREDALEKLDSSYDTLRENTTWKDKTQQMTCQIELGDTLKALAGSYGIESASLVSTGKVEGSVATGNAKLLLNEQDAASYNMYMDYSTGESYLQIPELTGSYLDMTSTFQEASAELSQGNLYSMLSNIDEYLPKTEQLNTLITTYSDIILKNIKQVKRSGETMTAGGISGDYTRLDVTCDGEEVNAIMKEVLESLKEDETVKELIENVNSDGYAAFQESVTNMLSGIETDTSETDDSRIEMAVYVDNKAKITGRVITFLSGGESFEIRGLQPQDGEKFGYELAVCTNDVDILTIAGSGEEKSGKLSGDFTLSVDESYNPGDGSVLSMTDLIKISVKDLDGKALQKDGAVKGTVEISSDQIPAVAGYSLKIEADGSKDQSKAVISVMVGSDVFAKMTLTLEEGGEDPGVTKPAADAVTYDLSDEVDLTAYVSEIDLVTFLTELQTKCGVDLTALIGTME